MNGSDRIADATTVAEWYGQHGTVDLATIDEWPNEESTDRIPVVPEHLPSEVSRLAELDVRFDPNAAYELPPRLRLVLEPHLDDLDALFEAEDRFSERLFRLDRIEDGTFYGSYSSYFRSFRTHFCPEVELAAGRTLRDLTDDLLVDDEGGVRSLAATPFSNHLGGGALAVTADGRAIFTRRSGDVAVARNKRSLSFGGSAAVVGDDDPSAGLDWFLRREARQEIGLASARIHGFAYLGTVRRMQWMGTPDLFALALVDGDADPEVTSQEHTDLVERPLGLDRRLDAVEDLFEPSVVDAVVSALVEEATPKSRAAVSVPALLVLLDRLR